MAAAVTHSAAPSTFSRIWQGIDRLRHRDGLIAGTMTTGLLGIATLASLAYGGPTAKNLAATVITGALAKFFGGADGAIKLFTDYFPAACRLNRSLLKPNPASGPTGIWPGTGRDVRWSQFHDPRLAEEMSKLFSETKIESVWDFGCGPDKYSKVFTQRGIISSGLDGNPQVMELSRASAAVQDLTVPFQNEVRDCVISIEVGAKIPPEHADQFLANINAHATKMAIISWPVPGQKGPNQRNRQHNEYVVEKMDKLGWELDLAVTARLRGSGHPIYYWTQDTLMAFRRKPE
jgi:hypothetical protein